MGPPLRTREGGKAQGAGAAEEASAEREGWGLAAKGAFGLGIACLAIGLVAGALNRRERKHYRSAGARRLDTVVASSLGSRPEIRIRIAMLDDDDEVSRFAECLQGRQVGQDNIDRVFVVRAPRSTDDPGRDLIISAHQALEEGRSLVIATTDPESEIVLWAYEKVGPDGILLFDPAMCRSASLNVGKAPRKREPGGPDERRRGPGDGGQPKAAGPLPPGAG